MEREKKSRGKFVLENLSKMWTKQGERHLVGVLELTIH